MRRPAPIAEQLALFPDAFEPRSAPLEARQGEPGLPPASPPVPDAEDAGPALDGGSPGSLEGALARMTPDRPVSVRYTRNRTIILSLRPDRDGGWVLRAHRSFRAAPAAVADAAVRLYLGHSGPRERRRLSGVVTRWHQDSAEPPRSVAPEELRPGRFHDLPSILERVRREWFPGGLDLDITFGDRTAKRLMGRHERREPRSLVVINPVLDHPWITAWYLEYLVYHECLHEVVPPVPDGNRLLLHPPEFRRLEARHPFRARAPAYERWIMGPAWPTLRSAAQKSIQAAAASAARTSAAASPRRSRRGQGDAANAEP